jgi:hypothetical protein
MRKIFINKLIAALAITTFFSSNVAHALDAATDLISHTCYYL